MHGRVFHAYTPLRSRPIVSRSLERYLAGNNVPHDITGERSMAYTLPPLPYPNNALEPHIDAKTMEIHHDKHHNAYVTNLNAALEGKGLPEQSIEDLCRNIEKVP